MGKKWQSWQRELAVCNRCSLAASRNQVVWGEYNPGAKVFLLGEAPGGQEDREGKPFVGQAGQVLRQFLQTTGLKEQDIYISNVVKCRPVKPSVRGHYGLWANRPPKAEEIKACGYWLKKEIELIKPKVLVTLGGVPLSQVAQKGTIIGLAHGQPFISQTFNLPVFPLYHPAAVIYDQSKKAVYEEDLVKFCCWLKQQNLGVKV